MLYWTVVFADNIMQPWAMLHIKCLVFECRSSEVIPVVLCCIVTDSPVLMVCTLASRPVRYPDWLETNVECRVLDMRTWWCLANINLSPHSKSSLSLMVLRTSFLAFCCTSASAYTRDKMTINTIFYSCYKIYMPHVILYSDLLYRTCRLMWETFCHT